MQRESEKLANERLGESEQARIAEGIAKVQAQNRLKQVEKGNELLAGIFEDFDIKAVKKSKEPVEAVLAERLLSAAKQLDEDAIGDPLTLSSLRFRLGSSLVNLGYAEQAIPILQESMDWS